MIVLQFIELFVSTLVHLSYGFYIFSTGVASDWIYKTSFEDDKEIIKSSKDLIPIVLVHGIFGFGKGVNFFCFVYRIICCCYCSFFYYFLYA